MIAYLIETLSLVMMFHNYEADDDDGITHNYDAEAAYYNYTLFVPESSNEIIKSDLSSAATYIILQHNTNIYVTHLYMGVKIFTNEENLITYDMRRDAKIKMLFHGDHAHRCKFLEMKRNILMVEASRSV